MSIHKELAFEDGIYAHLETHGWLYEAGSADRYDRARALFVEDLAAWVQESQPLAWATLEKVHGGATATTPRWRTTSRPWTERIRAGEDAGGGAYEG